MKKRIILDKYEKEIEKSLKMMFEEARKEYKRGESTVLKTKKDIKKITSVDKK